MDTHEITLTDDEIEDIRFALAIVADRNDEIGMRPATEQAARLRALARRITGGA
ncbi:MAG: hypothetical protein WC683_02045 [bacterium]